MRFPNSKLMGTKAKEISFGCRIRGPVKGSGISTKRRDQRREMRA